MIGCSYDAESIDHTMHMLTEILDAESCLRQAMLDSDLDGLDRLIADDLLFTNHLGQVMDKQADLSAHSSGILKFRRLDPSERSVLTREHFAVVTVLMNVEGSYAGEQFAAKIRYTRVWSIADSERLQVLAGHSSLVQS